MRPLLVARFYASGQVRGEERDDTAPVLGGVRLERLHVEARGRDPQPRRGTRARGREVTAMVHGHDLVAIAGDEEEGVLGMGAHDFRRLHRVDVEAEETRGQKDAGGEPAGQPGELGRRLADARPAVAVRGIGDDRPHAGALGDGLQDGPRAHRLAVENDAWLGETARRDEVDRAGDVLALVLPEREAVALALAVSAQIEGEHAEALGQEHVGETLEPVAPQAVWVPVAPEDGPAGRPGPAAPPPHPRASRSPPALL